MNKSTLLLAVVAVLAGCATQEGVRPYWTLRESNFAAIKPQITTKADVEQMVGRPILTFLFRNLSEEVWDYRYTDGVEIWVAEVHFDLQGTAKYLATYPDRCAMGAIPCR